MTDYQKHNDDIAYFISFCIETFKNAKNIDGSTISEIFSKSGLTEFLSENFETLHTQSPQWIIEEINEYLSTHK